MAVRSKEELISWVKERAGEDYDDETVGFIEDLSDTWDDWEKRQRREDEEDWKSRYEENDREWRRKYVERFTNSAGDDIQTITGVYEPYSEEAKEREYTRYEDLFTENDDSKERDR